MANNEEISQVEVASNEEVKAENQVEVVEAKAEKTEQVKKAEKAKAEKKSKKSKDKKPNKIAKSLKETSSELKKVTWPKFGTVVKQTGVVLLVTALFLLVVFGIDRLCSWLVGFIV